MVNKVIIDNVEIYVSDFLKEVGMEEGKKRLKIGFHFKVTSEKYHDITTLLYKNDFIIKVPEENLEFPATIENYTTSITNLYEENNVGDFKLVLIEKAD